MVFYVKIFSNETFNNVKQILYCQSRENPVLTSVSFCFVHDKNDRFCVKTHVIGGVFINFRVKCLSSLNKYILSRE